METTTTKNAAQAKGLLNSEITCVVMDGKDLLFSDFQDWVVGTVSNYSGDSDWEEMVEEENLDMDYIETNIEDVFAELKKLLK